MSKPRRLIVVNGKRPHRDYDDPIPGGTFRWQGVDRVDIGGRLTDERPTGQIPGKPRLGGNRLSPLHVPPLIMPGLHPIPPPPRAEFRGFDPINQPNILGFGLQDRIPIGPGPEINPRLKAGGFHKRGAKRRRYDSSGMP